MGVGFQSEAERVLPLGLGVVVVGGILPSGPVVGARVGGGVGRLSPHTGISQHGSCGL